jgi:hypothetical protein
VPPKGDFRVLVRVCRKTLIFPILGEGDSSGISRRMVVQENALIFPILGEGDSSLDHGVSGAADLASSSPF